LREKREVRVEANVFNDHATPGFETNPLIVPHRKLSKHLNPEEAESLLSVPVSRRFPPGDPPHFRGK
jgi:hypothetical protein